MEWVWGHGIGVGGMKCCGDHEILQGHGIGAGISYGCGDMELVWWYGMGVRGCYPH